MSCHRLPTAMSQEMVEYPKQRCTVAAILSKGSYAALIFTEQTGVDQMTGICSMRLEIIFPSKNTRQRHVIDVLEHVCGRPPVDDVCRR